MYGTGVGDERTSCIVVQRYDTTVIMLGGCLDQAGARGIEGSVRFATADAEAGVLIDCTACQFVDSSGLRLLVESQQMAAARGIGWRMRAGDQLRKLLIATSLDDMLTDDPVD